MKEYVDLYFALYIYRPILIHFNFPFFFFRYFILS